MTIIPVGPYRPDAAPGTQGVSPFVFNARMVDDAEFGIAYAPLLNFSGLPTASNLPAAYAGSLTAVTKAGVYTLFVMTSTTIYKVSATGGLTSIGTGYNLPAGDMWSADQIGTKAIFTNKNDGMLQYDVELGGAVTAISGAPKARVVRCIFDVLFALDCDGDNKLMRNSDFDYTNWSSGIANYQPFTDATELLGMEKVSDGAAIIFQRNQVHIASRRADAQLYDLMTLATNQGAVNPNCLVPVGGEVYFVDSNGFKAASSGGVRRIGVGKVDRTFIGPLDNAALASITGAYDPLTETVRWRVTAGSPASPSIAQATGTLSTRPTYFDYSVRLGEFVPCFLQDTAQIFLAASPGYTMEDLDAFGTMDTITTSLDDRFWSGGLPQLAGISGLTFSFGFFTGAALDAGFSTAIQNFGQVVLVNSFRTVGDEFNAASYNVLTSKRLSDTLTDNGNLSMKDSGNIPCRAAGRFGVFKASFGDGADLDGNGKPDRTTWTFFRGFEAIDASPQGNR